MVIHCAGGAILAGGSDKGTGVEHRAGQQRGKSHPLLDSVPSGHRALVGHNSHGFQGEPPDLPGPFPCLYLEEARARLMIRPRKPLALLGAVVCRGVARGPHL